MVIGCHTEVLRTANPRWADSLGLVRHDIYHTAAYHELGGLGREGESFAFLHREGDLVFLWPYLLTPSEGDSRAFDVSSVYGYAGPVSSPDSEFIGRAWQGLQEAWRGQGVVSVFTRFHPLLRNQELVYGLVDGEGQPVDNGIRFHGPTVSLDLRLGVEEQFGRYHKNLRNEVRRSREAGFVTVHDERWEHLDDFVRLYRSTMARLHSRPEYLLDSDWVREFGRTLGKQALLFVTKWEGSVAAACLVMAHGSFLHYHLIGSRSDLLARSPTKALLDGLRVWGTENGFELLHLGGGVGGRQDSLYQSKRKFSPMTHEFCTGSWILDLERYRDLEATHRRRYSEHGIEIGEPGFFPIYRYRPAAAV